MLWQDLPKKWDVQIFTIPSTVTWIQYHTWYKPVWCSMVEILCIGWGGWGWAWFQRAASSAWWGGWGGWGWACSSVCIPAYLLPDKLNIQVWNWWVWWTTTGSNGAGWIASIVWVWDLTSSNNVICLWNGWAWWWWWAAAAVWAAWNAWTVASTSSMCLCTRWTYNFIAGWAWVTWGAIAWWAWTSVTLPTAWQVTCGWAWGWWTTSADFAWWWITWSGFFPSIPAPAAWSNSWSGWVMMWNPLQAYWWCWWSSSNSWAAWNWWNWAYWWWGWGGWAWATFWKWGSGWTWLVMIICT